MLLPHVSPSPLPRILEQLPSDHLLRDLVLEHEQLLARLDSLDDLLEELRDDMGTPESRSVATKIRGIADDLLNAEPHHEREEKVLFPELEARGVVMPPMVMRHEHDELRIWKKKLLAAASEPHPDSEVVAETAGTLAGMLRDHIHKENEVLYPMALASIRESQIWSRMRAAADRFGPCRWS